MGATRKDMLEMLNVEPTLTFHHSKDRETAIRESKNKEMTTGDRWVPLWVRYTRGAKRIHRGRVSL